MTELTMGSLFDGIGGFPLAAVRNSIRPLWASEIEPFPIEVTKTHFPDMLHVGKLRRRAVCGIYHAESCESCRNGKSAYRLR